MFTATHVVRITGLSYRQVDYILRSGLLRPSGGGGQGRGSPRRFSARDLVALRLAQVLLKAEVRVKTMAKLLHYVQRGHGLPPLDALENTAVWTDGRTVAVLNEKSAMNSRTSRCVTHIVSLGDVARHVRRGIKQHAQQAK